jgi:hypothetical protein
MAIALLMKQAGSVDYGRNIRSAVRGLWGGTLDPFAFADSLMETVRRGFTVAWYEGLAAVGLKPGDMNEAELMALNREIASEYTHVYNFMSAIQNQSRSDGAPLAPHLKRAEMWTNRFVQVKSQAMMMAGLDKRLKWVMNPIKEHCSSCLRLNGRVYRASVWNKYDIYPRKRTLACHGFRCGCLFEVTNDAATPGRPPGLP